MGRLVIRLRAYASVVDYALSHAELEQHLAEQVSFLRVSAQAFDAGLEAEAKRLATSIRVLVHDTGISKSLIGQLGLKESMRFEDTTLRHEVLPPGMTAWPAGTIVLHSGITVTQMKLGNPDAGTRCFSDPNRSGGQSLGSQPKRRSEDSGRRPLRKAQAPTCILR
jgi:hypothetical protein